MFMHPSGFTEGRRFSDHYFSNVIGIPLKSTIAVHHLIFGGVLDAYPGLKLVIGAWRRLSAGLFRAHRSRRLGSARLLRGDEGRPDRPI